MAGKFSVRPWPVEVLASIEDVSDPSNLLIDARPPERYRGDFEPVDPRAGHIPGAFNLPCRDNLDADGFWLDATQLRARFSSVGARHTVPAPGRA